jgi:hypothetical protein
MKSLLRVTSAALLTCAVAIPGAIAQISVGGGGAAIPAPQGTLGTSGADVSGGGSISAGNYCASQVDPGSVGPANVGSGASRPGIFWARCLCQRDRWSSWHKRDTVQTVKHIFI